METKFNLSQGDRDYLQAFKKSGNHSLREFNRATILMFLDKGLTITEIEDLLDVDRTTIWRIKKRFLDFGMERGLTDDARSGQPAKYTTLHEAELTALACGPVPKGRTRWTIRLLAEELKKKKGFETITYGSVRKMLKKNELKPWLRQMWCIQAITEEYRTRMYRLLELYQQAHDPDQPLVCMDEKSKQLLEDSRQPIPAKPGQLEKYDYEYKRKGTCNIFVAVAPNAGMRIVKVTDTRKKEDFAYFVEDLVENHFPKASCIQLVLDNLNTHFSTSIIEAFDKTKADRILDKVKFIHTPKHGSWLNMAEIEINIMDRQCTGGRIASKEILESEVLNWSNDRNEKQRNIEWKFTRQDADKKLSRHYVA